MKSKEIDLHEVLKLLREINDEAKQAKKSLSLFSDNNNWYNTYLDSHSGRIEKFNYMDYDPRLLADHGVRAIAKVLTKSWALWEMLCTPTTHENFDSVNLVKPIKQD